MHDNEDCAQAHVQWSAGSSRISNEGINPEACLACLLTDYTTGGAAGAV